MAQLQAELDSLHKVCRGMNSHLRTLDLRAPALLGTARPTFIHCILTSCFMASVCLTPHSPHPSAAY